MTQLAGPRRLGAYEDRRLDCQCSLEPIFDNVTRMALASGWTEDDVAYALLEFARTNIRALIEDRVARSEMGLVRQVMVTLKGDVD